MGSWRKVALADGTSSQYIKGDGTLGTYSDGVGLGDTNTWTGVQQFDNYVKFRTTDDQAHNWAVYTHTDDTFRINYDGVGNDEVILDTSGRLGVGASPLRNFSIADDTLSIGMSA